MRPKRVLFHHITTLSEFLAKENSHLILILLYWEIFVQFVLVKENKHVKITKDPVFVTRHTLTVAS